MLRGQAVFFPPVADHVSALDGSEAAISLFAGFAENAAESGAQVVVRASGLGSLFAGLLPGVLYFAFDAGPPVPFSLVPPGRFCREVGGATNPTTLLVRAGLTIEKGIAMPVSPAGIDSATGAIVVDTNQNALRTATAGAAINPFTALYFDSVTSKVFPFDGTLLNAQKYVGVSDSNTYALNATVSYAPPGVPLSGLTALVPGDYFAKDTDGSLVAFSAVGAQKYTRLVFDAQTTTSGVVVDGPIIQHP